MRRRNLLLLKIVAVLVALTMVVAACGGDDEDDEEPTPEPTVPPVEEPSPTPLPDEDDDATEAEGEEAPAGNGDLVAQGEDIFSNTCAVCHGDDASGYMAADIRGRNASAVQAALRGVPEMSGISLNRSQIEAVAAYLQELD